MQSLSRAFQGLSRLRTCQGSHKNIIPLVHSQWTRLMSYGDMQDTLQLSIDEKSGIATMRMNKPPVNSLNLEFLTNINITLEKLENSKDCSGLIITSTNPKIFCAGLDILEMYQPNIERLQEFWRTLQEMYLRLYGSSLITVAAINGHSPAGGCLVAGACDYRIMAPNFSIGLNETQLGIVAPFWFKDMMTNLIGMRQAEIALQLGTMFSTEQALNIGLIDKIVPQDQVVQTAMEEIKRWQKIPGYARQLTKSEMRKPFLQKLENKREEDIINFRDFITKDSIQKTMGMYLESLKQKKK